MKIGQIGARLTWSDFMIVRMMRRWAAARLSQENPLPAMISLSGELRLSPELAISLHSVFQLSENLLGRALVPECCCSHELSRDEEAMLVLIAVTEERASPYTTKTVPHGLPGALSWAVIQAKRVMGISDGALGPTAVPACPFAGFPA